MMRKKHFTGKEMKAMLQKTFEAPAPVGKEVFLRQYRQQTGCRAEMSMAAFIKTQLSYIRKRVWLLWTVLFLAALSGSTVVEKNALWIFAAMTPFLAVSLVAENNRSAVFGMTELEMASRFSVKSVLFARMVIMGPVHLALLFCLIFAARSDMYTFIETGVYLLLPYMLTTVVCLLLTRKMRGREGTYACMAAAILIAAFNDIAKLAGFAMYERQYFKGWLAAFVVLTAFAVYGYGKTIRQAEEMS